MTSLTKFQYSTLIMYMAEVLWQKNGQFIISFFKDKQVSKYVTEAVAQS